MVAGAGALAGILAIAVAPKTAHGLVAALVQISNTPSNPVPNRDVDLPARASIQQLSCEGSSFAGGDILGCDPGFTVPAGQRLVLQQLESVCATPRGNNVYSANIVFSEAGFGGFHPFALISEGDAAGVVEYGQNQQVNYYLDPGSPINFRATTTDTSGSTNCYFAVSGYLVSYP
jgi:hypothetical protein